MLASMTVFAAVSAILVLAAVFDVRSREVPDLLWIVMLVIGATFGFSSGSLSEGLLSAVGYLMIAMFMFSPKVEGRMSGIVIIAFLTVMIACYWVSSDPSHLVSALMALIVIGLHFAGLVKGGADVKALVSLSMVYPVYAEFGCLIWQPVYPAGFVFNPVFSTLLFALLFSLLFMIPVVMRNSKKGDSSFNTYVLPINEARSSLVWPVEDIREGHKVRIKPKDDSASVYDRLEEAGETEVRVTPMVPFLLPVLVAFLIVMIAGSPLFVLI